MAHHRDPRSSHSEATKCFGRVFRGRRRAVRLVTAGLIALAFAMPDLVTAQTPASRHVKAPAVTRCKSRNLASATVRFSDWIFPDTLNVFQTNTSVSYTVINAIQDSIFTYNARASLTADMGSTIPTLKNGLIKDGGKTITIRLRKGMRWSNNREITSADVRFGWQIGMNKATGPFCSGSCDAIKSISTPDKYTAILHLRQVYAPAIPNAMPPVYPTSWSGAWSNDSNAAAQKLGQEPTFNFEGPSFPTDGAYQVATFVRDDRIVMHPMKYYNTLSCGAYVK